MVPFCYLTLFLGQVETNSSHYGWQGRTGQDMEIGPIFLKFQCYAGKNKQKIIMASALWRKLFDIFFITLQEHFLHALRH